MGLKKEQSARSCEQESSSPTRRAVSFAQSDDETESVTIHSIPALSDMTKEEIQNTWYNQYEFKIMKLAIVQILRKVMAGTYMHDVDGLESEWRGLENKTPQGSNSRKQNRYVSLMSVLDEQDRQRAHDQRADPECIAQLYRQSSAHCQMEAIQIAANDATLLYGHQETSIYESKMSQTIPPPPASPITSSFTRSLASPLKQRSRRRLLSMMR
jgi:hypothetical protein